MPVYTTLVAGAAGVERRRFFIGIGPATTLWVIAFTLLGVVAGVPAEHFFTQVQQLAVQGGVLVAIGVGGYLAILRLPEGASERLRSAPGLDLLAPEPSRDLLDPEGPKLAADHRLLEAVVADLVDVLPEPCRLKQVDYRESVARPVGGSPSTAEDCQVR